VWTRSWQFERGARAQVGWVELGGRSVRSEGFRGLVPSGPRRRGCSRGAARVSHAAEVIEGAMDDQIRRSRPERASGQQPRT
jgi:hypothetical protein